MGAWLAAPPDDLCLLDIVGETLMFNMKLLCSVFLLVLITGPFVLETSVDNSVPVKNLLYEH